MIFKETRIQSLFFAVRDSRSPPHMPRTSPLSSSVFHAASALSAPSGHLPLEGEGFNAGKTVFSFCSLYRWCLGRRFCMTAEQPLREGARQRRRMDPHGGLKTNVKLSIPHACHSERSEKILSFAVRLSRFPHICHAFLRFPHLSFMPLVPYPPLRGTFPSRGRLTIRGQHPLKSGEAASFPFEPFDPSEPIEPAFPLFIVNRNYFLD